MRRHYRILVLTDSEHKSRVVDFRSERYSFIPGDRKRNYVELLSGLGIPYRVIDIADLHESQCLRPTEVCYSAILFTCPVHTIQTDLVSFLTVYSHRFGVSLITDAFLISGRKMLDPFGLKACGGLGLCIRGIADKDGNRLYSPMYAPHSAIGPDFGIRAFLRFILQSWFSKKLQLLSGAEPMAFYGGLRPAIVRSRFGDALNYVFNFHPSLVLKSGNAIHGMIRSILESNPHVASASFDLSNVACLRMDDAGSSERTHLEGFNPGILSKDQWRELTGSIRDHNAHLNVAYVPGWVDDGDTGRGRLEYQGEPIANRRPGALYNSWEVEYATPRSSASHDYVSQYQGILEGAEAGLVSVISHGLSHLTLDIDDWVRASSKYKNGKWYREFRNQVTGKPVRSKRAIEAMKASAERIHKAFGTRPEIIVPSGHEHDQEAPVWAREGGYTVFSSGSTFLLHKDDIIQNRKVRASYPEHRFDIVSLSRAGYPVIFVFHDYDIYRSGVAWLTNQILLLKRSGVARFLSMEEVCHVLMARMEVVWDDGSMDIDIDFGGSLRTFPPTGMLPLRIGRKVRSLDVNGHPYTAPLAFVDNRTFFSIPFSKVTDSRLHMRLRLG